MEHPNEGERPKITARGDVAGGAGATQGPESNVLGSRTSDQGGTESARGQEFSNNRPRRVNRECCLTRICRWIIRPIRESISRLTGKEIAVLISETVALGFGVTVAVAGLPKVYDYLTSTKWEDRDTGLDENGDGKKDPECLRILERTHGEALFIYNCDTHDKEACILKGAKPVKTLHNGISEISFTHYKSVTTPKSPCKGGYKETILEPK